VNAYKAYTSGSRHRQATFLVTAEGAERREIAARRPLGDTRPIREADVWLNMGRNLSRQPEQESALSVLERAHGLRRSAAAEMQRGLQRREQREVDGLAPTTLAPALQRRRVVERVAEMAGRLAQWTEEQGHVLDRLARLAPKTQEVVAQAIEKLRPMIQQAAERIQQRPERVAARQREAKMNAAREELLGLRMQAFEREQRAGRGYIPPGLEAQLADRSQAEDVRQRQMIRALGEPELRRSLRQAKATEHEREAHDRAPSRSRGMGMER
jgi:hypothetical protein